MNESKILYVSYDGLDGCPFCSVDFSYDKIRAEDNGKGIILHKIICARCERTWEGIFKLAEEDQMTEIFINLRKGEKVIINEDIILQVVEVLGGRVKLGFDCPSHVRVLRKELLERENNAETTMDEKS